MARIPDEEIERLKREISLERLVTGFGIELKRTGANLMGLCPFHEDHTPSLSVTPETNLWRCLGQCNAGGSTIDWVMKTQGVSFRHAAELLRAEHPSLAAGNGRVVRQATTAKLPSPIAPDADDQQTLRDVVRFYHDTLKESPEALRYLESRGLRHPETIAHFQLGFANRKLGLTLPEKNRKAGAELRGRLERLGILRETSGHEHMNGSVVFPIHDLEGSVLGMYGRKIGEGLRPGTPLHLYLPGSHRGVWNEEALVASKEIILCESIIDALTFWCAGFRNVTASYGVNGFTEDHKAALKKHGIEKLWIAYDRDEAGDKAAKELAGELMAMGIECYRVLFPHNMDANEYALQIKPTDQSLRLLLNSAEWLGKGKPPESEEPAAKEKTNEPVSVLAADVEVRAQEIVITRGDRRYRVRGFAKNTSYDLMKINLLVSRGDGFHVDTFNLYAAHQCAAFVKQAAIELGVGQETIKGDLRHVLEKLEEMQEEQIRAALEPKPKQAAMSAEDRSAALELLRDPNLLNRIVADFERCGLVGEETNKKVAYLAAVSRLLDTPLAVVVQSSSAAGKSSLMDAVLQFVPEQERIQYSAMTGQSLFYMGELDLKHKVLAIVEEEGASRAVYALKLLQSEGVLTIASTGKDPATGKLVTHEYRVEGPVMIFLTTTAIDLDEELLNRCLALTVDEDREQTRAIHRVQRQAQTLEGLLKRQDRCDIVQLHRNAQRLLKPIAVVNPHADRLTFPDSLTRTRRDHMKFLVLIRAITLLYQHQRPVKTATSGGKLLEYIESMREDVELAEELIKQVLGRSLDELPPQTRRLLLLIDDMVLEQCGKLKMERADFRFSRRDVRQYTGWSDVQVKKHMHKLEELEYLIVHQGGRGQTMVYELYFERPADPRQPFLPGLIDMGTLRFCNYDENKDPSKVEKDPSKTPQVPAKFGGGTGAPEPIKTGPANGFRPFPQKRTDTGEGGQSPVIGVGGL